MVIIAELLQQTMYSCERPTLCQGCILAGFIHTKSKLLLMLEIYSIFISNGPVPNVKSLPNMTVVSVNFVFCSSLICTVIDSLHFTDLVILLMNLCRLHDEVIYKYSIVTNWLHFI